MAIQNSTAYKIGVFSRDVPLLVFVFFLLIQPISVQGQNSSFDSIDYIIHDDQISDSLKIAKLSRFGLRAISYSYDSGMHIADKMSDVARRSDDYRLNGSVYQIYGILHAQYGDYENGINYFMRAYSIFEAEGDKFNLAKTMNNLAGIYSLQHEYTEALSMMDEALGLQKEIKDDQGFNSSLLSKASIYSGEDSIMQSMRYLDSCETYFEKNDINRYAHVLSIKGENFRKLKRPDLAFISYVESMHIADSLSNHSIKLLNLLNLGELYLDLDSVDLAEQYYLDGLKLAQATKHAESLEKAYLGLFNVYQKTGEYKKALDNHLSYMETKDKVGNERAAKLIQKLKYDFRREQQARELVSYKAKVKQNKLWFTGGILVLFSLAIALAAFIYFNRINKRNNTQLVELNKQIEKQNREIVVQSEKLKEANEEIRQINEHLEERILMRTRELERQNEKLSRFAFQTSHLLRGPVARIKGLLFLLKKDHETKPEDILRRIHQTANELDEQTSKMSNGLN